MYFLLYHKCERKVRLRCMFWGDNILKTPFSIVTNNIKHALARAALAGSRFMTASSCGFVVNVACARLLAYCLKMNYSRRSFAPWPPFGIWCAIFCCFLHVKRWSHQHFLGKR